MVADLFAYQSSRPGFHLLSHRLKISLHSFNAAEMASMRERDFECFAGTGVNTPVLVRAVLSGLWGE
jgi:hypothetical protein